MNLGVGTEHPINRVYIDAAKEGKGNVDVHPGNYRYRLEMLNRQGFRDLGVWNPHEGLVTVDPETSEVCRTAYRKFIAFPAGAFSRPVT